MMKSSDLKIIHKKIKVTEIRLSREYFHMVLLKIVELVLLSKMSNFYILGWKLHIYDIQFIFCQEVNIRPLFHTPIVASKQLTCVRAVQ